MLSIVVCVGSSCYVRVGEAGRDLRPPDPQHGLETQVELTGASAWSSADGRVRARGRSAPSRPELLDAEQFFVDEVLHAADR